MDTPSSERAAPAGPAHPLAASVPPGGTAGGWWPRVAFGVSAAFVALLTALVFFWRLDGYEFINQDEAFYHAVARRMVATGDWLRVVFAGQHRVYDTLINAPLQYWGRAALITAIGDTMWSVRLLSALCGVLALWATYRLGRALAGRATGLLAAALLVTNLHFVYLHGARTGELETAVAWLFAESTLALVGFVQGRRRAWHHAAWVAVLAWVKSPLVVPLLLGHAAFLVILRRVTRRQLLQLAVALGVAGLAAGSWHLANVWAFRDELGRAAGAISGKSGSALGAWRRIPGNIQYYADVTLFSAFPQVALWLGGLWILLRRAGDDGAGPMRAALLGVPAGVVGFFLLLNSRAPWYLTPAYPFLSVAAAWWIRRAVAGQARAGDVWPAVLTLVALLAWQEPMAWYNPLAQMAMQIRGGSGDEWAWPAGVAGAAGLLAVAVAAGAVAGPWRSRVPAWGRGALVATAAGLVLGVGAARVLLPLRHLPMPGRFSALAQQLADARQTGRDIASPVPVYWPGKWIAETYYWDDYDVRVAPERRARTGGQPPTVYWLLYPRGGAPPPSAPTPPSGGETP